MGNCNHGRNIEVRLFKRNTIKKLISENVDPALFAMSYDYVGEVSETVAHLWPHYTPVSPLPSLSETVETFQHVSRKTYQLP